MDRMGLSGQASANSIQDSPLRSFKLPPCSTLPILAVIASGLPFEANSADLSKAHDPHFESDPLAELADVIECRASTASINNLREGYLHSVVHPDSSPRYRNWKRLPTLDDKRIEIELPGEINVFGMNTKKVVLEKGTFRAILDGVTPRELSDHAGLTYRKRYGLFFENVGVKPVALKNLSSHGEVYIRAMLARESDDGKGVSVGCTDFRDSRAQQRGQAGLDTPYEFGAEADSLKMVGDVLSCRVSPRVGARFLASMSKRPENSPFISKWKYKFDETGAEWTLPKPIKVDGITISKIWFVGDAVAGVAEGTTPTLLGRRWRMEETENGSGDQLFLRKLNDRVASDGWIEGRERFVLQWEPGVTVTGCSYNESYPEYGWWPEEEEHEEGKQG